MDKLAEINANPHFLDSSLFMRQKTIIVGVNSASSILPYLLFSRVPQRSIATWPTHILDLHDHRWNH